jgi:sugar/nucleoside kinase (ribokinase family)
MHGVDLICPSERELRDSVHNYDDGLTSVVWQVLEQLQSRAAIITMGEEGLTAFERRSDALEQRMDWRSRLAAEHVPAFAPYAIDQLGCGDSLLAAATLTLAAGGSLSLAAILGSVAAAAQAQRVGNAVIGSPELRRGVRRLCEGQLTYAAEAVGHGAEERRDQLHRAHA